MKYSGVLSNVKDYMSWNHMFWGISMVVAAVILAACGSKAKEPGQSLVRVDGKDITVLQLNDEIQRANVQGDNVEAARKQLLEALIDRQLLTDEGIRNKVDRAPGVVQAIERAKSQMIAQAYLQSITSKVAKPTKAEIDEYYQKHPEFFSKRKQFTLNQLIIPEKNYSDDLKLFMDSAKTLEEVADWMRKRGVPFAHRQVIRSSMDLPTEAVTKLLELPKGQIFIVNEGDNRVINVIADIRDSPVTATNVATIIEQFLTNEKMKDAAKIEIAHLRALAKIEYLNNSAPIAVQTQTVEPDNKTAGPK